jgi:hypothetical protein
MRQPFRFDHMGTGWPTGRRASMAMIGRQKIAWSSISDNIGSISGSFSWHCRSGHVGVERRFRDHRALT